MNEFFYGQPTFSQMPQAPQMYGRGQVATGGNVGWIYVNGIDGARNQIVGPGQTCWMMDNNDPVFYCKSVSNIGQPTIEAYRFEKIDPGTRAQTPQIDTSAFATRAEMAELAGKVEKLISEFGGLNA